MVPQLLNLGSTQSNENFNNMVARKAPKNRAYGSTTSLLTRVSAAVLQKNEGYTYVNKVNELALLSPGSISQMHGLKMDKKRRWRKTKHATISYKRKRLLLKKRKQKKETVSCLKEGKTYETDIAAFEDVDVKEIPSKIILKGNENFVIFDLETTGLSRDSDIVQLAAYDGEEEFNAYIRPRQPISRKASEISGITYSFENDEMFHHGTKVQCEDVRVCLLQFMEYLQRKGKPVLVGHNIQAFDIPVLSRRLQEFKMYSQFLSHITGCIDTLKVSKRLFKKTDVGNCKQQTLVERLLGKTYMAHSAIEDVKILQELFTRKMQCISEDLFSFNIHALERSFKPLIDKKAMSAATSRRLARSGLGLSHINLAFRRDSVSGVREILHEHGFKGRTINLIQKYLQEVEE